MRFFEKAVESGEAGRIGDPGGLRLAGECAGAGKRDPAAGGDGQQPGDHPGASAAAIAAFQRDGAGVDLDPGGRRGF